MQILRMKIHTMTKRVAFLDTVHPVLWDGLIQIGFDCHDLTKSSLEEIEKSISGVHGIVIRSRFPMNADFLSKANQLEFIARSGAGMENIDVAFCTQNNIQLFNAPEGNRNAVAEHALGMLLSLFNKLIKCDTEVRNGIWKREENKGIEIEGKTIGIIGYGNNGSAFAKVLSGFGCNILAYDKYKSGFSNSFVQESTLENLLQQADVISLHIPQNDETTWMINKSFIDSCAKNIYLINLSRGKIVKTDDLVEGIKSSKVLGACLDVLEYEKSSFENMFDDFNNLPDAFQYILKSDKVILSPHVGGWTHESYYKLSKVLLNKILEFYKK